MDKRKNRENGLKLIATILLNRFWKNGVKSIKDTLNTLSGSLNTHKTNFVTPVTDAYGTIVPPNDVTA